MKCHVEDEGPKLDWSENGGVEFQLVSKDRCLTRKDEQTGEGNGSVRYAELLNVQI